MKKFAHPTFSTYLYPHISTMPDNPESDSYQTIAAPATGVFKDKGSKFLSFAYPVSTEDEIKEYLKEIKKEYFDARHHCFAYRLGWGGELWRVNDDGEPSSSAGKPILGQLRSYHVSDTLVIVVRYFGGTKLGIPGLINAYRQATANALQQSVIIPKYDIRHATLAFPYQQMNTVMKLLKESLASISYGENLSHEKHLSPEKSFSPDCRLSFSIRRSLFPALSQKLSLIDQLIITP